MPMGIEKRRLCFRWLGEALRETAVLVWVFLPLDWFLGRHPKPWLVTAEAFALSGGLFTFGVVMGFLGEFE